ncbi:30S ribosomal protein S18 [Candidatus Fermentibacteria bacterium]|nr:MAG: 30S ribosomal protein S18 [Candidatus Fermentibacteria bacterium]
MPVRKKRKGPKKPARKKKCRFCMNPTMEISYKNEKMVQRYISDRGKIVAKRVSGNCAKHQRMVARELKIARFLALAPFIREHYR